MIENVFDEGLMFWSFYKRCGKLYKRFLDILIIGLLFLLWFRRRVMVDRRGFSRSFYLYFSLFIMVRFVLILGVLWDNYLFIYEKCVVYVFFDFLICFLVYCFLFF